MDTFEKYASFYDMPVANIPRPQPPDFVDDFFHKAVGKTFIDVGAHDGITWNNSVFLQEERFWSGICVEANPKVFERLTKNRNVLCINAALSNQDGEEMEFWSLSGYTEMLSGFSKFYDERHIRRIERELLEHGGELQKIMIPSKTLSSILEPQDQIDYLSIDTEGSEKNILGGLDFGRWPPTLISVENNGYNNDVEVFLKTKGYSKIRRICGDDFYTRIKK